MVEQLPNPVIEVDSGTGNSIFLVLIGYVNFSQNFENVQLNSLPSTWLFNAETP